MQYKYTIFIYKSLIKVLKKYWKKLIDSHLTHTHLSYLWLHMLFCWASLSKFSKFTVKSLKCAVAHFDLPLKCFCEQPALFTAFTLIKKAGTFVLHICIVTLAAKTAWIILDLPTVRSFNKAESLSTAWHFESKAFATSLNTPVGKDELKKPWTSS